jgi:hypothetical protein
MNPDKDPTAWIRIVRLILAPEENAREVGRTLFDWLREERSE